MTERVDQRICIKFCFKLGHSSAETIPMIKKAFGDDSMSILHFYPFTSLPPSVCSHHISSLHHYTAFCTSPTDIDAPFLEVCTGPGPTRTAVGFGPIPSDINQTLYKTFLVLFCYYFSQITHSCVSAYCARNSKNINDWHTERCTAICALRTDR